MLRQLATAFFVIGILTWQPVRAFPGGDDPAPLAQSTQAPTLVGRVVALGIPGATAVSPVGTFHPGGPIRDKPEFAVYTEPHRILDPTRILVTSRSNFGAPLALADQAEGSVLSLDPTGADPLTVPAAFGAAGGQATALDGRVQLFTAQSPAFINGVNSPSAATAALPPVSRPIAISINNAFGRLWFANVPSGWSGSGTESIVDPGGQPLAGAPSKLAGGVFAGVVTNRQPEQISPGGLNGAAIGTALLGASPDGGGRAVFAVVNSDGSVVQAHAEFAVDGLAPAGTIRPLLAPTSDSNPSGEPAVNHAGMLFNWVPNPIIYIADPLANAVAVVALSRDDKIFRVDTVRRIEGVGLNLPVDLAPAVPEVVNPAFSSNTTLAGGSDMYVSNRGDGTITRLRQDGSVAAVRRIELPGTGVLGPAKLNGIAVSPDAQKIWVTVVGDAGNDADGMVLELPAFGS